MSNNSGKLTEEQKEYVVRRLAAFDRPSEVVRGLREEFGVEITFQAVEFYDPTKRSAAKRAGKWATLFHDTREELRKRSAEIGKYYPIDTSAKLTEEQKEYVVLRLAAYYRPSAVTKGLMEKFGVKITNQAVEFYDPTKFAGAKLSEKWKLLFHATREELRKGSAEVGASHALVRISWREDMALNAMEAGQMQLANGILDSIAKEVGHVGYRHRHERSDANGAPFVATINISGRPEPASAPQAMAGLPKPRD